MKKPADDFSYVPMAGAKETRAFFEFLAEHMQAATKTEAWAATKTEEKKEVPIMASWPQQKAIWAILRRVAEGDPNQYKCCDFEWIRKKAETTLTRKDAHNILDAFYKKDYHGFRGSVWGYLCDRMEGAAPDGYNVNEEKFNKAERRPKRDPKRFTYTMKEEGEEEKPKPKPRRRPPRRPSAPAPSTPPQERARFNVGDLVMYDPGRNDPYPWFKGHTGKIVAVHNPDETDPSNLRYGTEWDPWPGTGAGDQSGPRDGHSCDGKAKPGCGWNIPGSNLVPPPQKADEVEWPGEDWKADGEAKPSKEKKEKGEKEDKPKRKPQKKYEVVTPGYEKPGIFDDVCLMIENGVQVLLVGPSGCGKSMMITEIRKVLDKDLYVESFAGGKRYAQVFGSTHLISGESKWMQAEFLKAVQRPGIVFMDEVMSADADVLIGCNSLLDIRTRCFHTPEGKVEVHPECVIVGASNVSGREYSQNYKGTQQQDASILNRFVHVPMTYDKKVEENIVKNSGVSTEDSKNLLAWLNSLRQKISINNIMYDPSTRKLVQATEMVKMGMDAKKAFTYAFITPLSEIEKKKIGDIC